MKRIGTFLIAVVLIAGVTGCPDPDPDPDFVEIWGWYDLDAIREDLDGNYVLMINLDSTTAGYPELAGPAANDGKGWEPIGSVGLLSVRVGRTGKSWTSSHAHPFRGAFDGQGHEIKDLYVDRPGEDGVGLFGCVGEQGVIQNTGVVNAHVTGSSGVGGLVGWNRGGSVSNSYATGSVTGGSSAGGLVGVNEGTASNSLFTGSVTGDDIAGGLVALNWGGTVTESHSAGSVTGGSSVGGLVGSNGAVISNSYSTSSVTGDDLVGGLVALNWGGTVTESHSTGSVTGEQYVGGLVGCIQYGFQSTPKAGVVSNSYSTGSVIGDQYVGGLAGAITIATVNNSHSTGNVDGRVYVGGLVGSIVGAFPGDVEVSNSYSTGNVDGTEYVGGLIGYIKGPAWAFEVSNSYSTGSVTGDSSVGGLVGWSEVTVSNSFWDIETSGIEESDGGTDKTTAEMMNIATFADTATEGLDEPWDIIAVEPGESDEDYTWNIVDGQTYPFLSWEPVG